MELTDITPQDPLKAFGANLPFTTNLYCPSSDPLVPISASKKVMTCSGCLCILEYQNKDQKPWRERESKKDNKTIGIQRKEHQAIS